MNVLSKPFLDWKSYEIRMQFAVVSILWPDVELLCLGFFVKEIRFVPSSIQIIPKCWNRTFSSTLVQSSCRDFMGDITSAIRSELVLLDWKLYHEVSSGETCSAWGDKRIRFCGFHLCACCGQKWNFSFCLPDGLCRKYSVSNLR